MLPTFLTCFYRFRRTSLAAAQWTRRAASLPVLVVGMATLVDFGVYRYVVQAQTAAQRELAAANGVDQTLEALQSSLLIANTAVSTSLAKPILVDEFRQTDLAFAHVRDALESAAIRLGTAGSDRELNDATLSYLDAAELAAAQSRGSIGVQQDGNLGLLRLNIRLGIALGTISDASRSAKARTLAASERASWWANRGLALLAMWVLVGNLVLFVLARRIGRAVSDKTDALDAASASERRYRSLFDHHPLPMWIFDAASFRIVNVNDAALAQYGYTREQFTALSARDLRPQTAYAAFDAYVAALRPPAEGHWDAGIWDHLRADGSIIKVHVHQMPVEEANRSLTLVIAKDVTDLLTARKAEVDLTETLGAVLTHMPVAVAWKSARGEYHGGNARFARSAGLASPELLRGKSDADMAWRAVSDELADADRHVADTALPHVSEMIIATDEGAERCVRITKVSIPSLLDGATGILVLQQDITDQRASDLELRLLGRALQDSASGVLISRSSGARDAIQYANTSLAAMTGRTVDDLKGHSVTSITGRAIARTVRDAVKTGGRYSQLVELCTANGESLSVQLTVTLVADTGHTGTYYVCVLTDVTELVVSRELLRRQANFDALTGLPNRHHLMTHLSAALDLQNPAHARGFAVLMLDIDDFKLVNDTLGHATGDAFLVEVARRLNADVPREVLVARLGGDEFVMVVPSTLLPELETLCARILRSVSQPVAMAGGEHTSSGSLGVAVFPQHATSASDLLRCADTALYRAKEDGRGCVRYYDDELLRRTSQKLAILRRLRGAINESQLFLVYQPQFCLSSGALVGAEALVRWRDADGRIVMPSEFIPVAEEYGFISVLGEWVLENAVAQIARWEREGLLPPPVAVNVSAPQLATGNLPEIVSATLAKHRVPARQIEVEITEGMLVRRPAASRAQLSRLRRMGISVAVDDFGTGYSSLSFLDTYEIDKLKIDKSFVDDIENRPSRAAVVRAIIALSTELHYRVVAEGVETERQRDFLAAAGCHFAQGYLFARPLSAKDFGELIARSRERVADSAANIPDAIGVDD